MRLNNGALLPILGECSCITQVPLPVDTANAASTISCRRCKLSRAGMGMYFLAQGLCTASTAGYGTFQLTDPEIVKMALEVSGSSCLHSTTVV